MDTWQGKTCTLYKEKQAYLEGGSICPSRCNSPSVMQVFAGGPRKPLLPNDGRFPSLIQTVRESLCFLREEGDECILSAHSQLLLGRQDVPAYFVCPIVLGRLPTLCRHKASLHPSHKVIDITRGSHRTEQCPSPCKRSAGAATNVYCQGMHEVTGICACMLVRAVNQSINHKHK